MRHAPNALVSLAHRAESCVRQASGAAARMQRTAASASAVQPPTRPKYSSVKQVPKQSLNPGTHAGRWQTATHVVALVDAITHAARASEAARQSAPARQLVASQGSFMHENSASRRVSHPPVRLRAASQYAAQSYACPALHSFPSRQFVAHAGLEGATELEHAPTSSAVPTIHVTQRIA